MKLYLMALFVLILHSACQGQQQRSARLVGGPCEGCEAVFEYGNKKLSPVDTLVDFSEPGPKLKITGTVYQLDGKTPAKDVILYIYHANQDGIYPTRGDETGWARRHGYIRGWIKTAEDGSYTFYTLKPASYPSRTESAHIHITILEPDGKYYWIGSYFFEDDPLLTDKQKSPTSPRGGGTGILKLREENDLLAGERDIILGLNVPGYE